MADVIRPHGIEQAKCTRETLGTTFGRSIGEDIHQGNQSSPTLADDERQ